MWDIKGVLSKKVIFRDKEIMWDIKRGKGYLSWLREDVRYEGSAEEKVIFRDASSYIW